MSTNIFEWHSLTSFSTLGASLARFRTILIRLVSKQNLFHLALILLFSYKTLAIHYTHITFLLICFEVEACGHFSLSHQVIRRKSFASHRAKLFLLSDSIRKTRFFPKAYSFEVPHGGLVHSVFCVQYNIASQQPENLFSSFLRTL